MALSIRSPSVEKKARELARRTGGTMTEAIEEALDARLEHAAVEEVRLRTRLEGIAAICAAAPDLDTRSPEEILGYDRAGGFDHGDR